MSKRILTILFLVFCSASFACSPNGFWSGIELANIIGGGYTNPYRAVLAGGIQEPSGIEIVDEGENFCENVAWGNPGYVYSVRNGRKYLYEWQPWNYSGASYELRFFFCGTLPVGNYANYLLVDFITKNPACPTDLFGGMSAVLVLDEMMFGRVVDLQQLWSGAMIPLKPLNGRSTGDINHPYKRGRLVIGGYRGDISGNGVVNFRDFCLLASQWGKIGTNLDGDISGPEGMPDGCVDLWDIHGLAQEFLLTGRRLAPSCTNFTAFADYANEWKSHEGGAKWIYFKQTISDRWLRWGCW